MNIVSKLLELKKHQGFIRYFKNTSWLFLEKILRMVAGLFVGVWVARYLGPEQFGVLSYVIAFVGLFSPISKLGLDGIVSRNIAKNDCDIDILISTAVFIKIFGGFFIFITSSIYMCLSKEQNIYTQLSMILSFIYVIKSYEVIGFYYRAKVKAKYISISNCIAMTISMTIKIVLILSDFSLIYFALANLIDALFAMTIIYIFFKKEPNNIKVKSIKLLRGVELVKESWPLIFSSFFALVYINIDQLMIESILDSYNLGLYSAAVRVSSIWYFIPITIGWSVQSALVNAKKISKTLYEQRLQMLFTSMALMAYFLILPICFFSSEIIIFLFGQDYSLAGDVLALHIIASIFIFVGSPRGLWVINESYFKFALFSNVGAGVLNIMLNLVFIPSYGIVGAAWATLISYSFTYVLSGFLFFPALKITLMQLKSIFLFDTYNQYKKLMRK